MTNPLQKHIADSLAEFDKEFPHINEGVCNCCTGYENVAEEVRSLFKKSLLQLLSIARGEVENKLKDSAPANYSEDDYNAGVQEGLSQALDTLTITNLIKE